MTALDRANLAKPKAISRDIVMFLDFDGVTHPEPSSQKGVFCCLPNIEEVLRDFPGVCIVISSSWREQHHLAELQDFFCADIAPRVIGVTPFCRDPKSDWQPDTMPDVVFERQWEIETWLTANRPQGTPWIAIDDRPQWFRPDCPDLLVTSAATGFTVNDHHTLRAMMKARLS